MIRAVGEASVNGICVALVLIIVGAASAIVCHTAKQNSSDWESLAGLRQDREMEKMGVACILEAFSRFVEKV